MLHKKMTTRRTIRKYRQVDVPDKCLIRCVDAARLSPSAGNLQPLKYIIVNDNLIVKKVSRTLGWSGYIPENKPNEDEMPCAYIAILLDTNIKGTPDHDVGIAAMTISIIAHDEGLGSCIFSSIDKHKLRKILNLQDNLKIILVVSLGYPSENPVVDKIENGSIKYWLDKHKVLHVPKRAFRDVVSWNQSIQERVFEASDS